MKSHSSWVISAVSVWVLLSSWQSLVRPEAWPYWLLHMIPGGFGDLVTGLTWLGVLPLLVGCMLLIPVKPMQKAVKVAIVIGIAHGFWMSLISTSIHAFTDSKVNEILRMLSVSFTVMFIAAIVMIFVVCIPKFIHQAFLKK